MVKRGPKPKKNINMGWSPEFAYAVGLIATDGSLSKDGRHIDFTSKDREQVRNFRMALGVVYPITSKLSGAGNVSYRVQFSNVLLYNFLVSIGIHPAKSKTLSRVNIPATYFFDFLRGVFDGDGSFYSYLDPRWKKSFMHYLVICSASPAFIAWLREILRVQLGATGHLSCDNDNGVLQLRYAKSESSKIIKKMYYSTTVICLSRKRKKIERALARLI